MIRSKRDADGFLESFRNLADVDENGKYYVVVSAQIGTYTLMQRQDGQFTVHGRGDGWCDPAEVGLSAVDALDFVWSHRKAVNEWMKARGPASVR